MNNPTPQDQLVAAVQDTMAAMNTALTPLAPQVDSQPQGITAFALVATLRAYADLLSEEFPPAMVAELAVLQKNISAALKDAKPR